MKDSWKTRFALPAGNYIGCSFRLEERDEWRKARVSTTKRPLLQPANKRLRSSWKSRDLDASATGSVSLLLGNKNARGDSATSAKPFLRIIFPYDCKRDLASVPSASQQLVRTLSWTSRDVGFGHTQDMTFYISNYVTTSRKEPGKNVPAASGSVYPRWVLLTFPSSLNFLTAFSLESR